MEFGTELKNNSDQMVQSSASQEKSANDSNYGAIGTLKTQKSPSVTKETGQDSKNSPQIHERDQWSSKLEFVLSLVGYAVGLANVWRFPYLAYKYGGGSFLIPYTTMLVFVGLPLFYLELCIGQFFQKGPTKVFQEVSPIFSGLGYAMIICSSYVTLYYNVITAWTFFYMFSGLMPTLPWMQCANITSSTCNSTVSAEEDFFNHAMLGLEDDIDWNNFGGIRWSLVFCLLVAWAAVCGSLIKGVQSSGKVVYFTATFPFVVLIIFFVNGLRLEGALKGIKSYITPDWQTLTDIGIWQVAANQLFYSLGTNFGGLITMASYNPLDNNCLRDAVSISLINCATSVFAGFVVFSYLGHMAAKTNQRIQDVVQSGPALAFIVYPQAMGTLPLPQVWSFLFFLMLLTLGLDTMFALIENITTAITDQFESLRPNKHLVVLGTCFVGFLLGISMVSQGGIFLFTLLDETSASWNMLLIAVIEVFLMAWVYGTKRLFSMIEEMGMDMHLLTKWYWFLCWKFITPIILTAMVIWNFVNKKPVKYSNYTFPPEVQALGWVISTSSVAMIPIFGIWHAFRLCLKR